MGTKVLIKSHEGNPAERLSKRVHEAFKTHDFKRLLVHHISGRDGIKASMASLALSPFASNGHLNIAKLKKEPLDLDGELINISYQLEDGLPLLPAYGEYELKGREVKVGVWAGRKTYFVPQIFSIFLDMEYRGMKSLFRRITTRLDAFKPHAELMK